MDNQEESPSVDETRQEGVLSDPEGAPGAPTEEAARPRRTLWVVLFSPETRLGRFMRPFLRTVAFIVALFALGLLAAFILLYQPANRQLKQTQAELQSANQSLDELKADTDQIRSELDDLKEQNQSLDTELDLTTARLGLAKMMNQVSTARYALSIKDARAAQTAMTAARKEMQGVLPYVRQKDADTADLMETRVDMIATEINANSRVALQDMEILNGVLVLLDQVLAGQ